MARQYRVIKRYGVLREKEFFAALSKNPNVGDACLASNMPRSYVYKQRKENPEFAEKFDEAVQLGIQACEDRAQELAFKGIKRDVYYQGNKVGEQWEPSERLVEFWLKANKPEKYRENGISFNLGANSLVTVLSGMPRSDVLEESEKPLLEVKDATDSTERPADTD